MEELQNAQSAGEEPRRRVAAFKRRQYEPFPLIPPDLLCGLSLFILFLASYLATIGGGVSSAGDSAGLVAAARTLGFHYTACPAYILMGRAFALLPLGSTAFRLNLLSALCHSATLALLYFILVKLTRRRYCSVLAVLAPNDLFAVSLILLLFSARERCHADGEVGCKGLLLAFFFLLGLALTCSQTIALLIPAFALWLSTFVRRDMLSARTVALWAMALAVGLAPLIYLPVRSAAGPALNWGGAHFFWALGRLFSRPGESPLSGLTAGGRYGSINLIYDV